MCLEAVIYIIYVGPGIPILSYLYKSGIRPLITPGHQSEIETSLLGKHAFKLTKRILKNKDH